MNVPSHPERVGLEAGPLPQLAVQRPGRSDLTDNLHRDTAYKGVSQGSGEQDRP